MKKRIVFTDLDGTLLDHDNYGFGPAMPAIALLRRRGDPLVFCSSKTAAEMVALRAEIGNSDPFIVENGGAVMIPEDVFRKVPLPQARRDDCRVLALGRPYREIDRFLSDFCRRRGLEADRFAELSPQSLARRTGLPLDAAKRSLRREFDLPFTLSGSDQDLGALRREAAAAGFRLTEGGRYLHLTGDTGKGEAVERLAEMYRREWGGPATTVGLGDSRNDLDMLRAVDIPIVIPNPLSGAPLSKLIPEARVAPSPGPAGWNAAVMALLREPRESGAPRPEKGNSGSDR